MEIKKVTGSVNLLIKNVLGKKQDKRQMYFRVIHVMKSSLKKVLKIIMPGYNYV